MSNHSESSLRLVSEWPLAYVHKLEENWLTTIEQVIAACASPSGERAMMALLEITPDRLQELLQIARNYLYPVVVYTLEQPVDPTQFGLGALPPREKAEP